MSLPGTWGAVTPSGDAVVGGRFQGTVSFGGPAFTASFVDGFVAQYAP